MARTPAAVTTNQVGNLIVLCDDGTYWGFIPEDEEMGVDAHWFELGPPIPGSEAAEDE